MESNVERVPSDVANFAIIFTKPPSAPALAVALISCPRLQPALKLTQLPGSTSLITVWTWGKSRANLVTDLGKEKREIRQGPGERGELHSLLTYGKEGERHSLQTWGKGRAKLVSRAEVAAVPDLVVVPAPQCKRHSQRILCSNSLVPLSHLVTPATLFHIAWSDTHSLGSENVCLSPFCLEP